MIEYEKSCSEYNFDFVHDMLADYWKNIAINIIEWKRKSGEPLSTISEGLSSQKIEQYLYEKGKALFFKDDKVGILCLKCNEDAGRNVYDEPTKWYAIGHNYNKEYTIENSVLIKNNSLKTATEKIINYYCAKLADIELAKDVNRDANKTPVMIECDADTVLTAKNIFKKIHANEPVILKNKNSRADTKTQVLNTGATFLIDKLEDDYHNYESRILTILGLDNYVEDKKERVQTAEVESQAEYIISSFRASLRERQIACEKINAMFGLDLMVDYVKGSQIETDETENETKEEGQDNE